MPASAPVRQPLLPVADESVAAAATPLQAMHPARGALDREADKVLTQGVPSPGASTRAIALRLTSTPPACLQGESPSWNDLASAQRDGSNTSELGELHIPCSTPAVGQDCTSRLRPISY